MNNNKRDESFLIFKNLITLLKIGISNNSDELTNIDKNGIIDAILNISVKDEIIKIKIKYKIIFLLLKSIISQSFANNLNILIF